MNWYNIVYCEWLSQSNCFNVYSTLAEMLPDLWSAFQLLFIHLFSKYLLKTCYVPAFCNALRKWWWEEGKKGKKENTQCSLELTLSSPRLICSFILLTPFLPLTHLCAQIIWYRFTASPPPVPEASLPSSYKLHCAQNLPRNACVSLSGAAVCANGIITDVFYLVTHKLPDFTDKEIVNSSLVQLYVFYVLILYFKKRYNFLMWMILIFIFIILA